MELEVTAVRPDGYADDGPVGCGQIGVWLDGIEFIGLDQEGDGGPVCGTSTVIRKEGVFAVQGDAADRSLDDVVQLDPAVGKEEAKASPIFCNVF